jgi:transposase-like protein
MTLLDVQNLFNTDDKCREVLVKLRWPAGVECPRCHGKKISWIKANKQFDCAECEYHFSVLAGTVFNDSHLPLTTWFTAVLLLVEAKKGMSALQLKRTIWGNNKGSYKTAWYLCHRIRAAMKEVDQPMLDGTVEMDETYVGGRKRGQGVKAAMKAKEVVIGIRQRSGDLRFFHATDASTGTLAKYIRENISEDVEVIVTDEWRGYKAAVGDLKHETVNHGAKEYARYENGACISTNTVESAFSLLKRGIIGSWHKISAKHLESYLNEMTFRFNRRKRSDLFIDTLRHMVTAPVLTFDNLTAKPPAHQVSEVAVPF